MSANKWTNAEDELLLQLAGSGKSYAAIAEIMDRSQDSVRNRLSRLRNPKEATHRIIIHDMSIDEFGELVRAKELKAELERTRAFANDTYEDYLNLYMLCERLVKAYKNHRNTKELFQTLEKEINGRCPCPF